MTVAWLAEVPRLAGSLGADYDKSKLYTAVFVLRENPEQDQSLWELMPFKTTAEIAILNKNAVALTADWSCQDVPQQAGTEG